MGRTEEHADLLDQLTDAHLVHRARCGDRVAFGEVVRRHAPAAWRVAVLSGGSIPAAAEVGSRGLTLALATLGHGTWGVDDPFRPWLLRTVRELAIDARVGDADDLTPLAIQVAGDSAPGSAALAHAELPEPQRAALWLHAVEAMSAADAAAVLDLDPDDALAAIADAEAAFAARAARAGEESVHTHALVAFALPVPAGLVDSATTTWRTWRAARRTPRRRHRRPRLDHLGRGRSRRQRGPGRGSAVHRAHRRRRHRSGDPPAGGPHGRRPGSGRARRPLLGVRCRRLEGRGLLHRPTGCDQQHLHHRADGDHHRRGHSGQRRSES